MSVKINKLNGHTTYSVLSDRNFMRIKCYKKIDYHPLTSFFSHVVMLKRDIQRDFARRPNQDL